MILSVLTKLHALLFSFLCYCVASANYPNNWNESIYKLSGRRLNGSPCHYDNHRKRTICRRPDGSVFIGGPSGSVKPTTTATYPPVGPSTTAVATTNRANKAKSHPQLSPSTSEKRKEWLLQEERRKFKPPIAACEGGRDASLVLAPRRLEKWTPRPKKRFYIYQGVNGFGTPPALVECYRRKFHVDVWRDERMWELAQNSGALWTHSSLERHPLRVMDPTEAEMFLLPIDAWTSQKAGHCGALGSHEARMHSVLTAIRASPWWRRHGGTDHFLVSLWWGTARSMGPKLAEMLQTRAVIVTYDEYFAAEWTRVVVGPYVPHARLTTREIESQATCSGQHTDPYVSAGMNVGNGGGNGTWVGAQSNGGDSSNSNKGTRSTLLSRQEQVSLQQRDISVYFRGSVMHGVMCKHHGTWPRREAYFAVKEIRGGYFMPTESPHLSSLWEDPKAPIPDVCRHFCKGSCAGFDTRICSRAYQGRFTSGMYIDELRRSQWCLHFRGDTTTARRFYDSIAAGCVPIIVSDGLNLPFVDRLDWSSFTVRIGEKDFVAGREQLINLLNGIVHNETLLRQKQLALAKAAPHVIFGYGSPLDPLESQIVRHEAIEGTAASFRSVVADHILENVEVVLAKSSTELYRRFPITMANCDYKKPAEVEAKKRKHASDLASGSSDTLTIEASQDHGEPAEHPYDERVIQTVAEKQLLPPKSSKVPKKSQGSVAWGSLRWRTGRKRKKGANEFSIH